MAMFNTFVAVVATLLLCNLPTLCATALDDYVWTPDSNYGWVDMGPDYVVEGNIGQRKYTGYLLNMTSQRWLTDEDFSPDSEAKSIWWHYLMVIIPEEVKYKTNGSLYITGFSMGSNAPTNQDEDVILSAALATNIGIVTGVLFQIPNEHITFSSDPIQKSRSEDAIIAFTWDHFLKDPSQPEWLLRFPMVKASLRAMDTIKEFTAQRFPELETELDYFVVAGASKRGWTTWDVGAVDQKRVMAIVPIVLDAINFVAVEHHQYRAYGGWTYALEDYIDMNITTRFDDPNMVTLQENVDPFFYRDRLTMPKLVVNAGMDEFQQPDDTHYWWSDMPEPKHFLMLANTEHSCATGILGAVPSIAAFAQALLEKETVPKFDWTISNTTGEINVVVANDASKVHEAVVWYAYSCGENAWDNNTFRRDFRVAHLDYPCNCGIYAEGYCANVKAMWMKETLEMKMVNGKRTFSARIDAPTDGRWVAYFIDIKFRNKNGFPIDMASLAKEMKTGYEKRAAAGVPVPGNKLRPFAYNLFEKQFGGFPHDAGQFFEFTTEVSIWPNTFPYPDCEGESCGYRMV